MANALYPASLPQSPLVGTLSVKDQDATLRFQPDVGDPVIRNRYTAKGRSYSFAMLFSAAQLAVLDNFFTTTLSNGSLRFDWIDPVSNKAATFVFTGPYQIQAIPSTNYFHIAINLMRKAQ